VDRVEKLCERARVLPVSGADPVAAGAELLGLAAGDRWVAETALARTELLARQVPADAAVAASVVLLQNVLALGVLR
jgi:hypothetical protein